jgi:phosphatidylserine/phosphatidylglycerophosphate/cardiolipin synthase-like enzyme
MLREAGRRVRGALDPGQGRQSWAASPWLHDKGVELFLPERKKPFGKLHHKLMVIDDAIVVAGSFNYTAPANEFNDENIFVMGSPYPDLPRSQGGPVDPSACAELATFFRDEIERIAAAAIPYAPR